MSLPNIKKTIKRNIENSIGLLSVAGAGGGGKGKAGAGGTAKLKPPETSDLLRSRAYMGVLDLISEGPIVGPVLEDGSVAVGTEKLSSVFFDKVPVREPTKRSLRKCNISPSDIKSVGRLNNEDLRDAINNLRDLVEDSGIGLAEGFYYELKSSYETSFSRSSSKVRKTTTSRTAGSLMENRSSGGRRNRHTTTYVTVFEDKLNEIVIKNKGYGYTEAPRLRIRRFETNAKGQKYEISPSRYGTITTSIDPIGRISNVTRDGEFVWPANTDCTYTTIIDEFVPRKATSGTQKFQESQLEKYLDLGRELSNFAEALSSDDSIDQRVGFFQYELEKDVRADSLYYSPTTEYYSYHAVGEEKYERTVIDEVSNENVGIPNGYSFILPVIDENVSIPERQGQVYGGLKVVSLVAGGIIPFFIGRETATGTNGEFLSGNFIIEDSLTSTKKSLATTNKRDIIALNQGGESCYFIDCNQSQNAPPLGDTVLKPINLTYFSNFNDTFNFTDAAVRFNPGDEFQAPIPGFESSSNDVPAQKELLGRFKLGGNARKGTGNDDPRDGGDMAKWTTTLPRESPEVAHTHIISNRNVDSAIPTVVIEALGDTASEGDDIGRTLKQKINFEVLYGFEGSQGATNYTPENTAEQAQAQLRVSRGKVFRVDPAELIIESIFPVEISNFNLPSPNATLEVLEENDSASVILKTGNAEDGFVTGAISKNQSLQNASGISEADLGDYFFVIENFQITNSGSRYENLEDLNLSIFGESEYVPNDINSVLNVNSEGQIEKTLDETNRKFCGGLYGGAFLLVGQDKPRVSTYELQTDVPDTLLYEEDERRITLGLKEGIPIESLALSKFDQSERFSVEGIVTSPYFLELSVSALPKNEELRDITYGEIGFTNEQIESLNVLRTDLVFPGKSWENVRRIIKIRKLDFETESVLIQRSASLSHITEFMKTPFNYPFSALVSNNIDARNFSNVPERQYLSKLKLVSIPSNYCATKADGTDKRFLASTRESELRKLFRFSGKEFFCAEGNKSYLDDSGNNNLSTIDFTAKLFLKSFTNGGSVFGYNPEGFKFNLSSGGNINKNIEIFINGPLLTLQINEITSALNVFSLPLDSTFLNDVLNLSVSFNNSNIKLTVTKSDGTKAEKEYFNTSEAKLFLDLDTANAETQETDFGVNYNGELPGIYIEGSDGMVIGDIVLKLNGKIEYLLSGELIEVSKFPNFAIREKLGKHALLKEIGVNPIEALNFS